MIISLIKLVKEVKLLNLLEFSNPDHLQTQWVSDHSKPYTYGKKDHPSMPLKNVPAIMNLVKAVNHCGKNHWRWKLGTGGLLSRS